MSFVNRFGCRTLRMGSRRWGGWHGGGAASSLLPQCFYLPSRFPAAPAPARFRAGHRWEGQPYKRAQTAAGSDSLSPFFPPAAGGFIITSLESSQRRHPAASGGPLLMAFNVLPVPSPAPARFVGCKTFHCLLKVQCVNFERKSFHTRATAGRASSEIWLGTYGSL